jgi:hypothetical protein
MKAVEVIVKIVLYIVSAIVFFLLGWCLAAYKARKVGASNG